MSMLRRLFLVVVLSLSGTFAPVHAQGLSSDAPNKPGQMPSAELQEVLIKQAVSMLNDANLANNYTVFHARIAPAFRRQFSIELIAGAFKVFRERKIDFGLIVAYKPEITEGPTIDSNGVLIMKGVFQTEPSRVHFDLSFADVEGKWLILGIHVNVKPRE